MENINTSFDEIKDSIDTEILKGGSEHHLNFLKNLNKKIVILQKNNNKMLIKSSNCKINNTKNSGLLKPVKISKELSDFLNLPNDTVMCRSTIIKMIYQYIKNHDLRNIKDKRIILLNDDLKKLLNVETNQITFCQLQKVIQPHFKN